MTPAPFRPIPLRIVGSGEYQPTRRVDSAWFDQRWGKPPGWTRRHVGIDYRRFAGADEPASLMGARAAEAALAKAGLRAADIDCLIVANSVPEQALPCTAVLVHRRLGLGASGIPAFDVNATCLGFLTALEVAANAMAAGRHRRVLIVASEVASAGLDWEDVDTAALFGDGAAAFVVEAGEEGGPSAFVAAHMETYSDGAEFCQVRAGGTRLRLADDAKAFADGATFEMLGKQTYRMAAQLLPGFLSRLLARAGVGLGELKKFVPHQASEKALRHLELSLRIPKAAMVRVLETRGNQMAASIPIALHHAISQGELGRGDLVALVGSGAGLSFAGVVLRY
jgi:3-oxoacyl-[acyl-carrier-protein] synthase-3